VPKCCCSLHVHHLANNAVMHFSSEFLCSHAACNAQAGSAHSHQHAAKCCQQHDAARRHFSVWLSKLHNGEMCAPQVHSLIMRHSGQAQHLRPLANIEWSNCDTLLPDTLCSWLGHSCSLLLQFKHMSAELQLCTKPLLMLCFHTQRVLTSTLSNQQTLNVHTRCGVHMHGQSAVHGKEVHDNNKQVTL